MVGLMWKHDNMFKILIKPTPDKQSPPQTLFWKIWSWWTKVSFLSIVCCLQGRLSLLPSKPIGKWNIYGIIKNCFIKPIPAQLAYLHWSSGHDFRLSRVISRQARETRVRFPDGEHHVFAFCLLPVKRYECADVLLEDVAGSWTLERDCW
jgi:hypothetical protein